MTDPVNTLLRRPATVARRPRTPQIHLVHMQYLMHGHGSQKCVQSDVSRCHFHSSPARAASKQRQRDLLATYLCVCLWRHCFGDSSYPLPSARIPLAYPRRVACAFCWHWVLRQATCTTTMSSSNRWSFMAESFCRCRGTKHVSVSRGCCRRCPLGAFPKYNLSFWSNEFGKGSRKPKSPQNSKGAQKFKNLAYIWEPLSVHPQPSLLLPSCFEFCSGNWIYAKCQRKCCPCQIKDNGVGREGLWSGQRPRKTHHIWHFKWLSLRYEKLRFVSALSPVFPTSCKVFTILSTFWVECILTHTHAAPHPQRRSPVAWP